LIFHETKLPGAYIIDLQPAIDERGFFARTWCEREFLEHGLNPRLSQCNLSYNKERGTFRGMHYQTAPHEEAKLVRCSRGAIYDVIVDLRSDSPTFRRHIGEILTGENRRMLYVPETFAHGFITLEDDTEVSYQMSESYYPDCARGFRWNDPAFDIRLPIDVTVVSDKDRTCPDFGAPSWPN